MLKHDTKLCTSTISLHAYKELPFTDVMSEHIAVREKMCITFRSHVNIWEYAPAMRKLRANFTIIQLWLK